MIDTYVKLPVKFFNSKQTIMLAVKNGLTDAYVIPVRLWAFAAEHQRDGNMSSYGDNELAEHLKCPHLASGLKQLLTDHGFLDENGIIPDIKTKIGGLTSAAELVRVANRRFRELRAKRKGTHTDAEWKALVAEFNGMCVGCCVVGVKLTKDHIIPISKNGSDTIENIQPLCGPCNSLKGTQEVNWVKHRRLFRASN